MSVLCIWLTLGSFSAKKWQYAYYYYIKENEQWISGIWAYKDTLCSPTPSKIPSEFSHTAVTFSMHKSEDGTCCVFVSRKYHIECINKLIRPWNSLSMMSCVNVTLLIIMSTQSTL